MSDIVRTSNPVHPPTTADGMDASIVPRTTDLQWQNSTPYGVYVHAWVSDSGGRAAVHVQLWSSPYWHVTTSTSGRYQITPPQVETSTTPGCVPRRGVPGFGVDVTRTSVSAGQPRRVETFHSSYSPLDAIRCRGGGAT
jgi:VanW like protein